MGDHSEHDHDHDSGPDADHRDRPGASDDHGHGDHEHGVSDCQRILQELDLFLDGELSDDARTSIDKHLHACTDCFQAFDFHAELKTVIATKCHNDELPPGLIERLESCLDTDLTPDADPAADDA